LATQLPPIAAVDPAVSATGSIVLPPETVVVEEVPVVVQPSADDIEKGADGLYHLQVGNKIYKAKTIKALLQETAKAIASGDTRIRELNTELKFKQGRLVPDKMPDVGGAEIAPLTAEEKFQLSQDLLQPGTMPQAVARIIEAKLGMSLDTLRTDRENRKAAKFRELAFSSGKEFVKAHPEMIPSQANEAKLIDFMEQENSEPISLKNWNIAYAQIKDTLDLRDENEPAPPARVVPPVVTPPAAAAPVVPAAPVTPARPRQATTGVTSSASSLPANAVPTVAGIPGYPTRAQIEAASSKQVETWTLTLPKFGEHMEALYAPKK
jgi:hypothetical protein